MMGKSASSFNDVPKLSHDDMVTYIESELQVLLTITFLFVFSNLKNINIKG